MKTRPSYVIIDTRARKGPTIVRVAQEWPYLQPGEIAIRFAVEFSDELLPRAHTVVVEDPDATIVAIPEAVGAQV